MLQLAVLSVLAVVGAGFDLATRQIPNWFNLLVLLIGAGFAIAILPLSEAALHGAHFVAALLVAMLLFRFGAWGGGDAKFYSALAIWFPLAQGALFALLTALAGLVLVVAFSLLSKKETRRERLDNLPYGLAIAVGAIGLSILSSDFALAAL